MCVSVENINQPYFCNVSHASNANILCSRGNLNILVLTSFHVQGHVRPLQTAAPWARAEGLSSFNMGHLFSIWFWIYCCICTCADWKYNVAMKWCLHTSKKTGHFLTTNRSAEGEREVAKYWTYFGTTWTSQDTSSALSELTITYYIGHIYIYE